MKKILTLLTFVFLTNALLFGQCPYQANPNSSNSNPNRFFNLRYATEAERDAALVGLESITFPLADGTTVDILLADLIFSGPHGGDSYYRIRADGGAANYFGGDNVNFIGDIIFNFTDGSSVACTFAGNALPIDLISFDGIKKDRQINLTWKTASEINNEGFVVERGHKIADEIEWNRLGFIEGKGTVEALQVYSFIDQNPTEGNNYYRLKQISYDGNYEYSAVITVEYSINAGGLPVTIFPNPVKSHLTLTNGEGQAIIYNVLGQAVKHLTIDADEYNIQLPDLLKGQYYLQVLQANGTVVTKQFSKVN